MTADEFRAARKALGLTQEAMAYALGLAPRTIRSYEKGDRRVPEAVVLALAHLRTLR
jgi:D-3-phosphoglycerate dehydrogenase / 2-oxoglutarate reductase